MRKAHGIATSVLRVAASAAILALLAACNFLPSSGPYTADIVAGGAESDGLNYKLVPVNVDVVRVLASYDNEGLIGTFRNDRGPVPNVKVGVGDVVGVTIFEASAGGLFIPSEAGARAGNFVDIPAQSVDNSGNISIPYAGLIKAAGREPAQIEAEIVQKLRNRAIEPQAVVTVRDQRSTWVTVIGEVNQPVKFPLRSTGERVLDALSQAGTNHNKGYDTIITLQRGGREASISFNRLIRDPTNNIYLQPGDTIYVYGKARKFMAFGATGVNGATSSAVAATGQFPFGDDTVTLTEAVAKVGGINDLRGDPRSVYLFRMETRETLSRMGVDLKDVPEGVRVPTIYVVNFGDPTGFLLASKIYMRDKDMIYMANAGSVDLTKFLNVALLSATTFNEFAHSPTILYGGN